MKIKDLEGKYPTVHKIAQMVAINSHKQLPGEIVFPEKWAALVPEAEEMAAKMTERELEIVAAGDEDEMFGILVDTFGDPDWEHPGYVFDRIFHFVFKSIEAS